MDATTQLSTDVPLYFRFYLPTTGAPYAPTPAPTVTVYRVNEADGTRTALVAALTALTAISGLTGAYTYLLDDSLNSGLGQVLGDAVTTDAALTPYPEYATRTYIAQVVDDLSAADVNAQVLDVLVTDTFAEPAAVPAATASLKDKIGFLMLLARNKRTQTAAAQTVRNDADSATVATSTLARTASQVDVGEWT